MGVFQLLKKNINPASSGIYVVINAVSLFVTYKKLGTDLGIGLFGIWSLFITFNVSFALFLTGFSGSLVRFLPEYIARDETNKKIDLIKSSISSAACIAFLILSVVLFFSETLIHTFVHTAHQTTISQSFSLILGYIFFSNVGMVAQSVLEGNEKIFIKNFILIVQSIVILIGILGQKETASFHSTSLVFFYASLCSFLLTILALLAILKLPLKALIGFDFSSLKTTFQYHTQYVLSNLFGLLLEPINKLLLLTFAGSEAVGIYEMASKFVLQARTVLVSGILALIPTLARKNAEDPNSITHYYAKLFRLNWIFSIVSFGSLSLILGALSVFWFGVIQPIFMQMGFILIVGWFINNLCLPAFGINAATGGIRMNTLSSIGIILVDVVFGIAFGLLGMKEFVIVSWFLALCFGGVFLTFKYNLFHQIKLTQLFKYSDLVLICVLILLAFVQSLIIPDLVTFDIFYIAKICICFVICIFVAGFVVNGKELKSLFSLK